MSETTSKTSASAVSASLRRGGLRPLPSGTPVTREGLRVKRSGHPDGRVLVIADLDGDRAAARLAAEAYTTLSVAGYVLEELAVQARMFYVHGRHA